eukprot:15657855-Heterocapsa_arctica.AAC.1
MDFTESAKDNNGFRYGFLTVVIFTKVINVVAVKDQQPNELVRAFKETLDKMGNCEVLLTDME